MADDDYEIIPLKEIAALKTQLNGLQKKLANGVSDEIVPSMDKLSGILENMLKFFEAASEGIKAGDISEDNHDIMGKLNEIITQNETIAEGIVAIADMVKEIKEEIDADKLPVTTPEFQQPEPLFPRLMQGPPRQPMPKDSPYPPINSQQRQSPMPPQMPMPQQMAPLGPLPSMPQMPPSSSFPPRPPMPFGNAPPNPPLPNRVKSLFGR